MPGRDMLNLSEKKFDTALLAGAGVFYAASVFVAWGWPSVDGYPAIERFIDPGFLKNDFYTGTSGAYNVDTLLAASLGWLQESTGVHYDIALAALNLIRCLVWPLVIFGFFRAMSGDRRIALAASLLGTASLFTLPNLFAWSWLWGDPSTALFSILFVVLGWTAFLERHPAKGMAAFTIALLAHPLMAVHGGVFTALIYLVDYSRAEKLAALKSPAAWLAGLIFAAVFATQYLLLSATPGEELSTPVYTHILAEVRHPTDFLPSRFSWADWVAGFASMVAAGITLWKMRPQFPKWRLTVAGLGVYVLICIAGWLFVEVAPVRFFVELIPFRHVIVAAPLMLYAYGVFAQAEIRDGRWTAAGILAVIFFAGALGVHSAKLSAIVSVALAAFVGVRFAMRRSAVFGIDKVAATFMTERRAFAALGILLVCLAPLSIWRRAGEYSVPRASNQHPLYAWAASETPPDAVFLIDQSGAGAFSNALDPQRLRLVGRRAVVASKDFPFLDQDMVEWNDRWSVALGAGAPRYVSLASAPTLKKIATQYPYDFVVRDAPLDDAEFSLAQEFAPYSRVKTIYVYERRR